MTNLFRASNWISESQDSIVSRGVTTCAGMTAHTVILAQTRVWRSQKVFSRSTRRRTNGSTMLVLRWLSPGLGHFALSWAHLTWKASLELLRWWGHVWAGRSHFYFHDHELSRSPPDESFLDMLKQNCCLSGPHFPPPAIVEVLQDYVTNYHKVRRLHLIVVDLWRPWEYNSAQRNHWPALAHSGLWWHPSDQSISARWPWTSTEVAVDLHMVMLWMALNSSAI